MVTSGATFKVKTLQTNGFDIKEVNLVIFDVAASDQSLLPLPRKKMPWGIGLNPDHL